MLAVAMQMAASKAPPTITHPLPTSKCELCLTVLVSGQVNKHVNS